MNGFEFTTIAFIGSVVAGFFGALTGLGGGVIIVPLLTLVCGIDIHYAIGASLVSIIATSSGAAAAYVKDGLVNLRVAMFLGIATTLGAIIGAIIAIDMPTGIISIVFGSTLILTTFASLIKSMGPQVPIPQDPLATKLKLNGQYIGSKGLTLYNVAGVPIGFCLMFLAGALSGLLGIGSGAVKVLALDTAMHIPFRVSTATSNLMIGVTAAASAGLYLTKGYVNPGVTLPVMLGVLLGAFIGAKMLKHIKTKLLRRLFAFFILIISIQMGYHGIFS